MPLRDGTGSRRTVADLGLGVERDGTRRGRKERSLDLEERGGVRAEDMNRRGGDGSVNVEEAGRRCWEEEGRRREDVEAEREDLELVRDGVDEQIARG